ncbi:hypothetical protein GCM10008955_32960 [Deinococcus malanensis]|uniref:Nudix hydrolase domain-containing protein n=2 Tax=Deinococcus malanensis TaxID=1706855 RepID=A0ABQ2F0J6_9DEIO|nr:hypothetical protein GCM10008955_32960 [Deinococcus malanensis]
MIDSTWYRRVTDVPVRQAAGGIVVHKRDGQVWVALTIEHEPEFDVVALPKGGVETGESPLQAAVREIREETGLRHLQLIQPEPLTVEGRYACQIRASSPPFTRVSAVSSALEVSTISRKKLARFATATPWRACRMQSHVPSRSLTQRNPPQPYVVLDGEHPCRPVPFSLP